MIENTHFSLTELVISLGFKNFNEDMIDQLLEATIEPDKINKELIAKDISNLLTVPIKWLINHTVRSKYLALLCITKAVDSYQRGNMNYIRLLGWGLHYIVDRATPHHSVTSNVNNVPILTGLGIFLGGLYGGLKKSGQGTREVLKGIAKGAIGGGALGGSAAVVGLAIDHNAFEIYCDNQWNNHATLIEKKYKKHKKIAKISENNQEATNQLSNLLDQLHEMANNLSVNWRTNFIGEVFADYMVKIASVMEIACKIVIR